MIEIIFFDNKNLDKNIIKKFNINFIQSNIEDIVNKYKNNKNVAFISAANSLLFMDGGSDLGYMKSINNIEKICKKSLLKLNKITNCGRPFLPIGSSQLIIPQNTFKFISSPTMFLPQKVQETKNPYYAFSSALNVAHNYNKICSKDNDIRIIFTPFMCANWGGIDINKSIEYMLYAYFNYTYNNDFTFINTNENIYFSINKNTNNITNEQPKIYMNTEFGIDINDVINNKNSIVN